MNYRRTAQLLCVVLSGFVSACAAVDGYPTNPINPDADMKSFVSISGPDAIANYFSTTNPVARQALRNQIVQARIAAYDVTYQHFEGELYSQSALEGVAGDLTVLTLNGLGATTGGAGAKAALAAASAGVTGARASIDKDVFYNKALPAVLAQMEASRAAELALIEDSLKMSNADYPLSTALGDLIKYRDAGSLPTALNILTANANAAKSDTKTSSLMQRLGPSTLVPQLSSTRVALKRGAPVSGKTLQITPTFVRNLP